MYTRRALRVVYGGQRAKSEANGRAALLPRFTSEGWQLLRQVRGAGDRDIRCCSRSCRDSETTRSLRSTTRVHKIIEREFRHKSPGNLQQNAQNAQVHTPTSLSLPTAALQIVCLPRQRRRVLLCSNSPPSHPAILLHHHITYPKVSPCPRCCPHSPSAHQCNLFASQLLTSGSTEPSNHGQGTMCRRQNTISPILTADYRSASTVSVALAASSSATRKFAARPATPPTPPQELTLATTASSTAMLTLSLSTIPSLSPSMLYVYHNRDMRIGAVPGGSLGTEDADG